MTKEELNRAISEARGICLHNETFKQRRPDSGGGFYNDIRCKKCGTSDQYWVDPRDWTGSEDASAVLRDEMPEPEIWQESSKGEPKLWGCVPDLDNHELCAFDEDYKTAIALAWLKWKQR